MIFQGKCTRDEPLFDNLDFYFDDVFRTYKFLRISYAENEITIAAVFGTIEEIAPLRMVVEFYKRSVDFRTLAGVTTFGPRLNRGSFTRGAARSRGAHFKLPDYRALRF